MSASSVAAASNCGVPTSTSCVATSSTSVSSLVAASSLQVTSKSLLQSALFSCGFCRKQFNANRNLRKHVRHSHKDAPLPEVRRGRKPKVGNESNDTIVKCTLCNETCINKKSLSYHQKRKHAQSFCTTRVHRQRSEKRTLDFDSINDFQTWKALEEDATMSRFVKGRPDKSTRLHAIVRTYYCNRSGRYVAKDGRLRHLKVQGSCKIGGKCPSTMFVKISSTGLVKVTYYPDHPGHTCDIAHIRMRKEQREQIASKLASGIPYDNVLDSVHTTASSCTTSNLNNLLLISKKDISNIAHEFGINRSEVQHTNDADSLAAWIEQTKQDPSTRNLVRFIKFQGESSSYKNVKDDDFMLVLATDAQLIGAQKLCGPLKEICLDSAHGLNSYNFQMTTLMTIDEHGEGFPIAFCYSNRVDESSMSLFLQVLKEALGGSLGNMILMTDDTEVYSNAWEAVMGMPAYRLLCSWHIDRAWRKNLPKIKDKELQTTIYKTIRALMELTNKETFNEKLQQFLVTAKEDGKTAEFAKYFDREYASRPQLWAYCFRLGLKVHHNMHLEAMHRVIKHVHLGGLKVRRMDKSIHALMKFVRSKMSDRLLKMHKGKWTRHLGGIRKRHKASGNMSAQQCSSVEANVLYSVSASHGESYSVRQSDAVPHEENTCPMMCQDCDVCVHAFSCTCLDAALRNTICKHIHLVIRSYHPVLQFKTIVTPVNDVQVPSTPTDIEPSQQDDVPEMECESEIQQQPCSLPKMDESEAILIHMASQKKKPDLQKVLSSMEATYSHIRYAAEGNLDVANVALQHLTKLKSLVTALLSKPQEHRLPPAPPLREPANKKAPRQRYFRSTKKTAKRTTSSTTATKPTKQEKDFLLKSLDGDVPVISCQPPSEHDYDSNLMLRVINFEHSYCGGNG